MDDGELINNNFTVPVTDASYWFAFTLTNLTDHALSKSVYVDKPYLNKVNLHYQQQGKWVSELNGTDIVLNKRKVRNVLPIFIVSLGAHESRTFYVEAHSKIKLLKIMCIILIGITFNNCTTKQNIPIIIPVKCIIPITECNKYKYSGQSIEAVSYTHLTLPTNREV